MKKPELNPFLSMARDPKGHPVDQAVEKRFGQEALERKIHLVADAIAQRLGHRRRKLGRLMSLLDKYHNLKEQAYFNIGYEHGAVDGGIKTFVETNQLQRGAEYRKLAQEVGRLAAQHLLPEHLRAAALIEAAWSIIAGKQ